MEKIYGNRNVTYYVEKSDGKLMDEYQMKRRMHTHYQCPEDQWEQYFEVAWKVEARETGLWAERH